MDGPNLITRRKLWAFIDISQKLWVLREIIPAIFSSSESEPLGNKVFVFASRWSVHSCKEAIASHL